MQDCGIRYGGRGRELTLKLSLLGLKVLNYFYIIEYILYRKIVS